MPAPANLNATHVGTATDARRRFLDHLASLGESEKNVSAHALGVDRFAEFLAPLPPEQAQPDDLETFLSYLSELNVSAGSLRTYRTVVGRWLEFLGSDEAASPALDDGLLGEQDEVSPLVVAVDEPTSSGPLDFEADEQPPSAYAACDEALPTAPRAPAVEAEAASPEPAAGGFDVDFEPVEPPKPTADFVEETGTGMEAVEPPPSAAFVEAQEPGAACQDDVGTPDPEASPGADEPPASVFGGADFVVADGAGSDSFAVEGATASSDQPAESGADWTAASAGQEALPGFDPSGLPDVPELDDGSRAAEERDRAKLQAPPLPALEGPGGSDGASPNERELDAGGPSIPLAAPGPAAEMTSIGESTQRGDSHELRRALSLDPTNGAMATQPGTRKWSVRSPRGERRGLTLDAIMGLAVAGELEAEDLVRKPSGEWVCASDLRPLRRALGLDGGPSTVVRRAREEMTLGRAAAGATVAGLGSGLLWWFAALAVGAELVPLAILGGLLGGLGARLAGRRPGMKVGLVGAGAAPVSLLVGRYLVYESLAAGVTLEGFAEVGGLGSFLGSGFDAMQLTCLGLGLLAGFLMGAVRAR
jgi:hypothetical protein